MSENIKEVDIPQKKSVIESFLNYLTNTNPLMLMFHLFWILVTSMCLSGTYVIAFHFTSIMSLYQEAHDTANFNRNLLLFAAKDSDIILQLNKLLTSTESDRTYVFRYHNGLAAVSGVPFFFQTQTHEVIKPGNTRITAFHQRIPVGVDSNVTNAFIKGRCAILLNVNKDPNNQDYWFFETRNAKSLIRCPVFVSSGDLLGFVGVDYTETPNLSKMPDYVKAVQEAAKIIGDIYKPQK